MAREKDKIMRKNLAKPSRSMLKGMLSLDVLEIIPLTPIVRQTIIERETDTLLEVKMKGKKAFILHWEYQSSNDSKMIQRMAIYDFMTFEERKMDVMGVVIYIGKKPMTMKNSISFFGNYYSCRIIDIRNLDPQIFLQSTDYKEVILALLAGPDDEGLKAVILRKILAKLRWVFRFSDIELAEKIKEMECLAQLRGPIIQQLIVKELQKMAVILDPRKSLFYKQGMLDSATNLLREGIDMSIVNRSTGICMSKLVRMQKKVLSQPPQQGYKAMGFSFNK